MGREEKGKLLFLAMLALAGLIVRAVFVAVIKPMDGDSAVFALMAKHISELKEFPVYMWLNHYAGSLSSYLAAALFLMFGVSPAVYSSAGLIFSFLWMVSAVFLAREIFGRSDYVPAICLVLLPPSCVLNLSLFGRGVYPETLLFGTIVLFLLIRYIKGGGDNRSIFALLGFSSGVGFWLSPALLPFILTALTVFLIYDKKVFFSSKMIIFVASFIIGFLPSIIYEFQYPAAILERIGGRILALDRSVLTVPNVAAVVGQRILWRMSTAPVSLSRMPALLNSLIGVANAALFYAALLLIMKKDFFGFLKDRRIDPMSVLALFAFWFAVFHILLVGENKAKYMLPLYAVIPLFTGWLLLEIRAKSYFVYAALLTAILVFNSYTIGHSFLNRDVSHYPQLARWLEEKNFRYGYSDYHTAYIVTFDSKENVLISPTLLHPTFSDRHPQYTSLVRNSPDAVYILRSDDAGAAGLRMEALLRRLAVGFKKDVLEEFLIYHSFSRKIYPEELAAYLDIGSKNIST